MTTLTATELKNRLGEMLERAQREPVAVKKSGRDYAVILSYEEFQYFQALDDSYWSQRAMEAEQEGFLGPDESMRRIHQRADDLGISLPGVK